MGLINNEKPMLHRHGMETATTLLGVAAGVLYPFFGLLLSPIIAAAAMSFSSVSIIADALRLKRAKL